jgi:hypothetical protein
MAVATECNTLQRGSYSRQFPAPDRHPEGIRPRRRRHGRTDPAARMLSDICPRHHPSAYPRQTGRVLARSAERGSKWSSPAVRTLPAVRDPDHTNRDVPILAQQPALGAKRRARIEPLNRMSGNDPNRPVVNGRNRGRQLDFTVRRNIHSEVRENLVSQRNQCEVFRLKENTLRNIRA